MSAPLLVLAYNRPAHLTGLIDALRPLRPQTVLVAVDGPRRPEDRARVQATRDAVGDIDWGAEVTTRFRDRNLGLRHAVADAVSWALEQHDRVIVVEDDVAPGRAFLPYLTAMLDRFADDDTVAHVSGYHAVPAAHLTSAGGSRFTRYPESFAWGTWARAWREYDPSMGWARSASLDELNAVVGSRVGALRWRQHFADAAAERIDTWAYRWIASMWANGRRVVAPNRNLVTYTGYDTGTHTTLGAVWPELPRFEGDGAELAAGAVADDPLAERWTGRVMFGETMPGVVRGAAVSAALGVRKALRARGGR